MSSRIMKPVLIAALALTALAGFTSSAMASRGIGTSTGSSVNTSATGPVTLTSGLIQIICTVRLNATVNASVAKSAGSPLLTVTSGTISGCGSNISGTILPSITVGYQSFTGTLPNIASITGRTTTTAGFLMTGGIFGDPTLGRGCLLTAAVGSLTATFTGNPISVARFSGTVGSGVTLNGGVCPPSATLTSGSMTVSPTVGLRLIN